MSTTVSIDLIIENLRQNLPPLFNRKTVQEALGQTIKARTLANLDALKQGPPKFRLGKNVFYERESFLEWLISRLRLENHV